MEERKGFTLLDTAPSSHYKCFICGRKNTAEKLQMTPKKSIAFAFKYFELVIKTHSRMCGRHFSEDNEIRIEEYDFINRKKMYYTNEYVRMLRTLSEFVKFSTNNTIFEPFNNTNSLEESHCKMITSWSKDEFILFASYLTSWKESNGRKKNEIIALYRYYMKTGLTQSTIALLRGNTTQRDVSRYLEQMRKCISDDFVDHFLGIKNRPKEFFLAHQTPTCKEIFALDDDTLVLIADGYEIFIFVSK
jgi:hypothetical protein